MSECELNYRRTTVILHAGPEYASTELVREITFHRTPIVGELIDVSDNGETFVPVEEVSWDLRGVATITIRLPQDDSDIEDLLSDGWKRLTPEPVEIADDERSGA